MDDDELLREALRIVLEGAGYEVMEASDGRSGCGCSASTLPISSWWTSSCPSGTASKSSRRSGSRVLK